jgi:O-antigen ligase
MNKKINIINIPLFVFALFALIPNAIKGLPVILLFITSFFLFLKKKSFGYPIKKVLGLASLYIILLLSLINTTDFEGIEKLLTTSLSLLVIPISMGFLYSVKNYFSSSFLLSYTKIILGVTTFYSLWILFFLYQLGVFSKKISMYDAIAYITNEMWFINQHPIYASIFIAIPILVTVYFWFLLKQRNFILFTLPLIVINLFALFILERKGVLLSFVFGMLVLILSFVKKKFSRKLLTGFILTILVIISVFMIPSNRFKELYKFQNYSGDLEFNSTSLRFGIYSCSISKIKEAPLFGFGIGDVQNELENCYKNKSELLLDLTYNSHNQYLSYFLSSGFFGFLLLFIVMLKTIIDSKKTKNILLLSISIFFVICMLFENILERQSGVILFSFYICFFSFYNFSVTKDLKSKE